MSAPPRNEWDWLGLGDASSGDTAVNQEHALPDLMMSEHYPPVATQEYIPGTNIRRIPVDGPDVQRISSANLTRERSNSADLKIRGRPLSPNVRVHPFARSPSTEGSALSRGRAFTDSGSYTGSHEAYTVPNSSNAHMRARAATMQYGSHLDVYDFSQPRPRVRSNPTGSVMDGARSDTLRRRSSMSRFSKGNRYGSFGSYQQHSNISVGDIQEDDLSSDVGIPDFPSLHSDAYNPPPELMPGDLEVHKSPTAEADLEALFQALDVNVAAKLCIPMRNRTLPPSFFDASTEISSHERNGTSPGRGAGMLSGLSGVVDILDTVLDESNVDASYDPTHGEAISPSIDILDNELELLEKSAAMPSLELSGGMSAGNQHEQAAVDDDDDVMDDIMSDFY
eukprot:m.670904 g.670904  ORF g.670904 m.670904 type:complete len:395 (+) comp22768_c0_seq2:335-1519(+)